MDTLGFAQVGSQYIFALISHQKGAPFLKALEWSDSKIPRLTSHGAIMRIASLPAHSFLMQKIVLPALLPWQIHKVAEYRMKNAWSILAKPPEKTTYFTEKRGKNSLLWLAAATRIPTLPFSIDRWICPLWALEAFTNFYFDPHLPRILLYFGEEGCLLLFFSMGKLEQYLSFETDEKNLFKQLLRTLEIIGPLRQKQLPEVRIVCAGSIPHFPEDCWTELSAKIGCAFKLEMLSDPLLHIAALAIGNGLYMADPRSRQLHFSGWNISPGLSSHLTSGQRKMGVVALGALLLSSMLLVGKIYLTETKLQSQLCQLVEKELPLTDAVRHNLCQHLNKGHSGLVHVTEKLQTMVQSLRLLQKQKPDFCPHGQLVKELMTLMKEVGKKKEVLLQDCSIERDPASPDKTLLILQFTPNEGAQLFYEQFCKSSFFNAGKDSSCQLDKTALRIVYPVTKKTKSSSK